MSLRSRLAALERTARRRRRRYPAPEWPRLEFDLADSETRAFLAEMSALAAAQPVRDLTRAGGRPIHRMQAALNTARFLLADFGRAERWLRAIDKARAVSPVSDTGASEHE